MSTDPRCKHTVLRQILDIIPRHLVPSLARKHHIDARGISAWSHVAAMIFGQLTHALSLNDLCDALANHCSLLRSIRGAVPPSRNGLAYANKVRTAAMAEELFWSVLDHLQKLAPSFGRAYSCNHPHRLKRKIFSIDSAVISLVANCMPWAKVSFRQACVNLFVWNGILELCAGLARPIASRMTDVAKKFFTPCPVDPLRPGIRNLPAHAYQTTNPRNALEACSRFGAPLRRGANGTRLEVGLRSTEEARSCRRGWHSGAAQRPGACVPGSDPDQWRGGCRMST